MKVKLTESKLKQIVAESVKKVLNNVINEGKTINNGNDIDVDPGKSLNYQS